MIVHEGNFTAKGHYYTLVKHRTKPKDWMKFDDENVSLIKEERFKPICRQAYILFYQRKWVLTEKTEVG